MYKFIIEKQMALLEKMFDSIQDENVALWDRQRELEAELKETKEKLEMIENGGETNGS